MIMDGLHQLSDLVMAQHHSRTHRTRLAVSSERLRFARDLHDLLGYSLSAITLQNELALRLVGRDDERARAELREAIVIARQALEDVRAVVSGYRSMSFREELDSVASALSAADVRLVVEGAPETLEPSVSTEFAAVLREAVTNALRHSRPTCCRVVLGTQGGRIVLTISNDGVPTPLGDTASARRRGSGLHNITARLATVGGTVNTVSAGEWFHLRAECPVSDHVTDPVVPSATSVPRPRATEADRADGR
jgi:two-component system sensor histidine kinase DesK